MTRKKEVGWGKGFKRAITTAERVSGTLMKDIFLLLFLLSFGVLVRLRGATGFAQNQVLLGLITSEVTLIYNQFSPHLNSGPPRLLGEPAGSEG